MANDKLTTIDTVLTYLSYTTTWMSVREKFPDIQKEEMRTLIRKLQRDNYIDIVRADKHVVSVDDYAGMVGEWILRRTFEGDLLIESGGYTQKAATLIAENNRLAKLESDQKANQKWLLWLTILASVGTLVQAIYAIVELYWHHGWFFHYPHH